MPNAYLFNIFVRSAVLNQNIQLSLNFTANHTDFFTVNIKE